ncbi:flagellar biosynthesis protein FlgL [Paenibacillus pectinilyticus]|uniref:Flagellar biosynthesis protein FlgL n=1 Tax=Paenibacillus pectinilyticus TaxID=512399 RepID=A0A1C0ZYE2_9BACL|nr:flagellar hook-associated protein FlgL [Paenibacillus pectinilyticus]OCT13150.1 flagellar biosynthesis protein FlgL [Paenibacillus pectinilyticus]
MATRITQTMINTQMLRNLGTNLNRMDNYQNQLATGRRINKPSDDPVGLSFAMRYRSELSANDQYQANTESATSWLSYTDSTLDKTNEVLQRVRELTVQAANGTNPQTAEDSINSEMKQLYSQLVSLGNSEFNGKHVFNGQMTDVAPYTEANASQVDVDDASVQFEIGAGVKLPVNVTGTQVFGSSTESDNVFKVMQDLIGAISTSDFTGISNSLGQLDSRMDKFLSIRSDVGAKMNRVDLSKSRLEDINSNLQSLQTKVEDADVAETMTNLKTAQNVYEASLSVGSQIIRPSLVDFLK